MREALIALPASDNAGRDLSLARRAIEARILNLFGGFTRSALAFGQWRAPDGKVYSDAMFGYTIAADCNLANQHALEALAREACAVCRQVAIYIRDFYGNVRIINGGDNV